MDPARFSLPTAAAHTVLHERDGPRTQDPAPTRLWSLARVMRQHADADVAIWTANAFSNNALHSRGETEMVIQHLLADGYEPFYITQEGSFQVLWFRAQ